MPCFEMHQDVTTLTCHSCDGVTSRRYQRVSTLNLIEGSGARRCTHQLVDLNLEVSFSLSSALLKGGHGEQRNAPDGHTAPQQAGQG